MEDNINFMIDYNEAKMILEECNKNIENLDVEKFLEMQHGVYSNYISSLIVKLVLAYGLKNDTIRKMKITDYDENINCITINEYKVHLPDGLAIQMKKYKKNRERFLNKYEMKSERLFFDNNDVDKKLDNTKMFTVLKKVIGNVQAEEVAKYAIVQLLQNGVPDYIISDFTGYKKDIMEYCQNIIDKNSGMNLLKNQCKILDAALIKIGNEYENRSVII